MSLSDSQRHQLIEEALTNAKANAEFADNAALDVDVDEAERDSKVRHWTAVSRAWSAIALAAAQLEIAEQLAGVGSSIVVASIPMETR